MNSISLFNWLLGGIIAVALLLLGWHDWMGSWFPYVSAFVHVGALPLAVCGVLVFGIERGWYSRGAVFTSGCSLVLINMALLYKTVLVEQMDVSWWGFGIFSMMCATGALRSLHEIFHSSAVFGVISFEDTDDITHLRMTEDNPRQVESAQSIIYNDVLLGYILCVVDRDQNGLRYYYGMWNLHAGPVADMTYAGSRHADLSHAQQDCAVRILGSLRAIELMVARA